MALSASTNRIIADAGAAVKIRVPGAASNVFYAGGYVQLNTSTGLATEAVDAVNTSGFGICLRQVTADGAVGDNEVELLTGPFVLKGVAVTGVSAIDDVGDLVYATDDTTLTLTPTANTAAIGRIVRWYNSSTTADVLVFPIAS